MLACDGVAYSRVDYKPLFDTIGTTWGAGDGVNTFNVPDLRDRALYGAGTAVGLGATDGVAYGSRGGPAHHHKYAARRNTSPNASVDGAGNFINYDTNIATSGGFLQDKPSHAGIRYGITTGM